MRILAIKAGYLILLSFPLLISVYYLPQMAQADQVYGTFQASQDAWISENLPTQNYGVNNRLRIRSAPANNRRSLVQFDLTPIPTGATIESAYLDMYLNQSPRVARAYDINRLTNSWLEGTGNNVPNDPIINGVTWYERQYGDNLWTGSGAWDWTSRGGDFLAATDSTVTPVVDNVWVRWLNLLPDVNFWYQNPSLNLGWLLKENIENDPARYNGRFISRNDGANPSLQPKLIVSYVKASTTIAPGAVNVGEYATMTVSISNSGGSAGNHIKEATFTIPAGYSHIPTSSLDYTVTAPSGKNWTITGLPVGPDGPQTVKLAAVSAATDDLANGETIQITFNLMTPWAAGDTYWASLAKGIKDGINNPVDQLVTVNGTTLTLITGGDQALVPVTLSGIDQITTGNMGMLPIRDARGTGAGWSVYVSATDFVKSGSPGKTIAAAGFSVPTAPAVTTVDGNAPPQSYSGTLAGAGFKLLSAALNTGMGHYQVTPVLQLSVPAETYAGTYTATVTETIVSGP